MLHPVGCNELLDFVSRSRSTSPEPSTLILSSNTPHAARRFIAPKKYLSLLMRAHSFQVESADERTFPLKVCEDEFETFFLIIQQESNARIDRAGSIIEQHPSSR